MRVLSLFDGMSCGMIAFRQLGIPVDEYHAFEIDKFAVQVSQHNFHEIIHHGDVFQGDFTKFKGFDWLIGGSPCTFWSIAQNKEKRETTANGVGWELFQQYIRALHEAEPEYFLYENNSSMSPAIRESISETFGFEPIEINSALVSAQRRKRLYWVGKSNHDGTYSKCMINQPEDRGLVVHDIVDSGVFVNATKESKAKCLRASSCRDGLRDIIGNTVDLKNGVAVPLNITKTGKSNTIKAQYNNSGVLNFVKYNSTYGATGVAIKADGTETPVFTVAKGRIMYKDKSYPVKLPDGFYIIRKLTVLECMKLQTVPDWYDFSVISNTQAYKCLGNGWTIEVIMHLISQAMQSPCFRQLELF